MLISVPLTHIGDGKAFKIDYSAACSILLRDCVREKQEAKLKMLGTLRLQLPTAVKMNPNSDGGANSLNHIKHARFILPWNNRGFTLSLSLQQQPQESRPLDSSHFTTSTVGTSPPSIHLSQWTLSQRHIHILNFIACAIAISATWLFCAAIPALLAFRRAADSMEKLMNVTREELPDTMAAVRLSGMELSDLTTELSDLGQEIMTSVKSSTRVVRLTEERLRRFTNNAPSGVDSNGSQGIKSSSS